MLFLPSLWVVYVARGGERVSQQQFKKSFRLGLLFMIMIIISMIIIFSSAISSGTVTEFFFLPNPDHFNFLGLLAVLSVYIIIKKVAKSVKMMENHKK